MRHDNERQTQSDGTRNGSCNRHSCLVCVANCLNKLANNPHVLLASMKAAEEWVPRGKPAHKECWFSILGCDMKPRRNVQGVKGY